MLGLEFSVFKSIFYPYQASDENIDETLTLRRTIQFRLPEQSPFRGYPLVVFDFETTGLDPNHDQIIEIGAIKYIDMKPVDQLSTLIKTDIPITEVIEKLTGINAEMLRGQPSIKEVLPRFLNFIEGSLLVAHNASFDMSFLRSECQRQGIDIEWPAFCTLKMAREYLTQLERKGLDALAEYYGFEFESRHRSIGDIKVTASVLEELLNEEGRHLETWSDLIPFRV